MSLEAMKWALQDAPIPHSTTHIRERLVLVYLADRHNVDTGVCWPSIGRIARDLGVSEPTVRKALRELETLGLITPASPDWAVGCPKGRRPNVWELSLETVRGKDGLTPKDGFTPKDGLTPEGETRVNPTPKDGFTPPLNTGLPKPKENPKPTQSKNPKVAQALPEGWMPDQRVIDQMRAECPGVDLAAEHRKFTDYFISVAGERGRKKDWNAAWRNWIRRVGESPRGAQYRQESYQEMGERLARSVEQGDLWGNWRELEK